MTRPRFSWLSRAACAFFACLTLSAPALAADSSPGALNYPADCPQEADVPGKVEQVYAGITALQKQQVAFDQDLASFANGNRVQSRAPLTALGFGSIYTDLLQGVTDYVEVVVKNYARVWVQDEIVSTLCSYQSAVFPDLCIPPPASNSSITSLQFNTEVNKARYDLQHIPACAFYRATKGPFLDFVNNQKANSQLTPDQKAVIDAASEDIQWLPYLGYYLQRDKTDLSPSDSDAQPPSTTAVLALLQKLIAGAATVPDNLAQALQNRKERVAVDAASLATAAMAAVNQDYASLNAGLTKLVEIGMMLKAASLDNISKQGAPLYAYYQAVSQAEQKDYSGAIASLQAVLCPSDNNSSTCETLSWVVQIADAKSGTEVESIIDGHTNQVADIDKKLHHMALNLNAFGGAQFGFQRLRGAGMSTTTHSYGLFAPVGLSFSTPAGTGYFSFMVAPVDLGALVTQNGSTTSSAGTTSSSSSTAGKRAFAPGAYLSYTFAGFDFAHHTPITVGLGYSHSPNAASLNLTSGGQVDVGGSRLTLLFLSWDVSFHVFSLN